MKTAGLTGLVALIAYSITCGAAELPAAVQQVIDGHGIATDQVSFIVQAVGADRWIIWARPIRGRRKFTPWGRSKMACWMVTCC
jgi:hypothetical protein